MHREYNSGNQGNPVHELPVINLAIAHGANHWPPVQRGAVALDTRQWTTRAARGLSWHGVGSARPLRPSH